MAESDLVFKGIKKNAAASYSLLTPNLKGLEAAISAGCSQMAVFTACSEGFVRKNLNCSISESLDRFAEIFKAIDASSKRSEIQVKQQLTCRCVDTSAASWGVPTKDRHRQTRSKRTAPLTVGRGSVSEAAADGLQ
jgi:isopropylmalate/homocitrate/citramalate synthase